jgi:hypothetical protein
MFETSTCANRGVRNAQRVWSDFRDAHGPGRRVRKLARRLCLAAVVACCWTGYAAAVDVSASPAAPITIAVFPFELEDFSAARAQGSSPVVTSYLTQSTEEAKKQLAQSGRYAPVDTAGTDLGAAKEGLRNCGGCEAAIAMKLGADQALIGVVTKISMTEYVVRLQVRDAKKGDIISSFSTDLRMGTSDSWFRGVRWLMKNRMMASK